MRAWTTFVTVWAASSLIACGGGNARAPDAQVDAPVSDAAVAPCDYTETADPTNDPSGDPGAAAPESTGLVVSGAPRTMCGTIDTGHYRAATQTVDSDAYRFTTDHDGTVIIRFAGRPAAADLSEFSVFLFATGDSDGLLFGAASSPAVRDHGAFVIALSAGTYDVVVTARSPQDLAAGFGYELQIAPDSPARCAVPTTAGYREAGDGGGTDNDVIAIDFDRDPAIQLTAADSDAAEPTGLVIGPAAPARISGSSAAEDADDAYMDRDVYLIRTGAAIGELSVRLGWTEPQANLDYFVFPADQTTALGFSLHTAGNEEYNVIAVKPDSAYWIWVGSHDGSANLPAAYDLTICGTPVLP
jgi:hypothetical protein